MGLKFNPTNGQFDVTSPSASAGVSSIAKSGSTPLTGAVTLSQGSNITLTQVGNDIAIASSGGGAPGGSNTQVQFNDSGAFGGDAGLTYIKGTDALTIGGQVNAGSANIVGQTTIDYSTPVLLMRNSAGAVNGKNWVTAASTSHLIGVAYDDAVSTSNTWLDVNRSGISISSITLSTGSSVAALTLNSSQLATFGGHLAVEGVTSTGATGTGNFVFSASPTIVTPTIASFVNANHNHSNAAGGGTIAITDTTGTLDVTRGGTGRVTSTTAYGLIAAGTTATGALQTLAAGATTEILVGGGASALPVWTTATGSGAPVRATSPTLVTPALGTPTALVGTNITGTGASFTAGTATVANGLKSATTTVVVSAATAPTSGQVLTASSSTVASWITPGSTIAWNNVTGTTQSAAVNNGYIANNAGLVTITIPSTAAIGQIVEVAGAGAGGWRIAQNASQTIRFGSSSTTTGTGGRLDSVNRYDAVKLICVTANTDWTVLSSQGNVTYT